jgi:hypothetical protein
MVTPPPVREAAEDIRLAAILDDTAPAGLTVTALARALPWSSAEQEHRVQYRCDKT